MKFKIENDTFGIADRLKAVEEEYFIVFDTDFQRYEVHSRANKGNTFCLAVPYSNLDKRTVDLVNMTRIENKEKFLRDLDKHNAILGG